MFSSEKFTRSRALLGHSLRVIAKDKKLLVFPALSLLSGLFVLLVFFAPALLEPTGLGWSQAQHWSALARRLADAVPFSSRHHASPLTAIAAARFVVFYFVAMFVTTFVNVAFYHEIMRALAGGRVSVRTGLAFAGSRLRSILVWTLFAASVGLVLQLLAERLGWVGRFILRLVGLSWSAAAVFVIPVIIREESPNPLRLLKISAATVKKSWGDSVIGFVGIPFVMSMILVLAVFGVELAFRIASGWSYFFVCEMSAITLILLIGVPLVRSADAIFRCALYVYATEGVVPEAYTAELMDTAWSVKKTR